MYNKKYRDRSRSPRKQKYRKEYNNYNYAANQQQKTSQDKIQKRSQERLSHLKKLLTNQQIQSYLDIGAGNCEISFEIAKYFSIKEVHCSDIYPEDKYILPENAVNNNSINLTYHQVQNNKLKKIKDQSIQLISCFMVMHHFSNFEEMISELIRVIKPQGYLFIREHDVEKNDNQLNKYLVDLHLQWPDFNKDTDTINFFSRTDLQNIIIGKGFQYISSSEYSGNNPQHIYHSLFKYIKSPNEIQIKLNDQKLTNQTLNESSSIQLNQNEKINQDATHVISNNELSQQENNQLIDNNKTKQQEITMDNNEQKELLNQQNTQQQLANEVKNQSIQDQIKQNLSQN